MKKQSKETEIKASAKFVMSFPLEFSEGKDGGNGEAAIPDTIHIIPIGQWEHDLYGPMLITFSDIREFAQNFNAGIRKGVYITAGHEGYEELPAVAWFSAVEAREDGLWGKVEWNNSGKSLLGDKAFKFFSPEFYRDYEDPQTHQLYRNVLTGGALTKSPYFKELEAIVLSDKNIKKFNNNTMDLQALLAKDITTLTDEEKAFIKSHASELTEDQKTSHSAIVDAPEDTTTVTETEEAKATREAAEAEAEAKAKGDANEAAGLNRDGSAKVEGSDKKVVQISASELQILRNMADKGVAAFAELKANKLNSAVSALTFNDKTNKAGKFLPKSSDNLRAFMEELSDAQCAKFTALIGQLPTTQIFDEQGVTTGAVDGTAEAEVEAKVEKKIEASQGKLKYSDALRMVFEENKGLSERYNAEVASK